MLKVNEFEYGMNNGNFNNWENFYLDRRNNSWYNYSSSQELMENLGDLEDIIKDFLKYQVPRLSYLNSYVTGNNFGIMHRRKRTDPTKADYRCRHNYGKYISRFISGYTFGVPVRIEGNSDEETELIRYLNKINKLNALNLELAFDSISYGRAFEVHFRNSENKDKIMLSSVFETFCIYDDTIEHKKIAAVRIPTVWEGGEEYIKPTVWTEDKIYEFEKTSKRDLELVLAKNQVLDGEEVPNPREHMYKQVPVIEWKNGRDRQGDIELVIPQIDQYDGAQSDIANYMYDFNEATLVIKGDMNRFRFSGKELSEQQKMFNESLREKNMLVLFTGRDGDGRPTSMEADYLYKQYDVNGTEAYKNRLNRDIHKMANVPDLSDENFSGTDSGQVMKYKTFGLGLSSSTRLNEYDSCLRERYQLISNIHEYTNEQTISYDDLKIHFTENLPKDFWEEINKFTMAGGELSLETMLNLLSFIDDSREEMDKLRKQEESFEQVDDYKELSGEQYNNEQQEEQENLDPRGNKQDIGDR